MLSRTANLIRRRGRWYFNKAFPKELWPITGRAPFRLSLQTDSLELAQRRRGEAERRYWDAVDAARAKLGPIAARELTELELTSLVSRWLSETTEFIDLLTPQQFTPDEHDRELERLIGSSPPQGLELQCGFGRGQIGGRALTVTAECHIRTHTNR